MEDVNLSVYERESDRLASKLQQLMINVEEFRLNSEPVEQLTPNHLSHDQSVDNLWVTVGEEDILEVDEDWLGDGDSW